MPSQASPTAAAAPPALGHIALELTDKCNLVCRHCYLSSGPRRPLRRVLTEEDWKAVLESARRLGASSVQLIGGEVALVPELPSLVAYARLVGFDRIEVYSNLTVLRRDQLEAFRRSHATLATSLYSERPEVHDAVTARRGSHRRTVANIRKAVATSVRVRVSIVDGIVEGQDRVATERFAISLGALFVSADGMRLLGRAAHTHTWEMSELCGACGDGRLTVDSTGAVFPCTLAKGWPIGDVSTGLSQALANASLRRFRTQLLATPLKSCEMCPPACAPNCGPGCSPDKPQRCDPWEHSCLPYDRAREQLPVDNTDH